jgi:hypothetical protein
MSFIAVDCVLVGWRMNVVKKEARIKAQSC